MSGARTPDRTRLEQFRDEFRQAARDHLQLDAVVVSQPDLCMEDAEGLLRACHRPDADRWRDHLGGAYAAAEFAHRQEEEYRSYLREVVPRERFRLNGYKPRHVSYSWYDVETDDVRPADRWLRWSCRLIGRPNYSAADSGCRMFELLTRQVAPLVLGGNGSGSCPTSRWLIYLADRDQPLHRNSERLVLDSCGYSEVPYWRQHTPQKPSRWWAVLLENVFMLSAEAIEQRLGLSTRADEPVHGVDFAWVRCSIPPGMPPTKFTFTASQANAVRILWHDWELEGEGVLGESLRDHAEDFRGGTAKDLFKNNPAWGTLIVQHPERKGVYRLALPTYSRPGS